MRLDAAAKSAALYLKQSMSFAEDLLEQADDLAHKELTDPKQASLRRAVSTAYYALFHLLIDEAVGQWAVIRQRSIIARTFDHAMMKKVCGSVADKAKSGATLPKELVTVATVFIQLQQDRHTADYDNSTYWSRVDVEHVLDLTRDAFNCWRTISMQDAAQDFLLAMLLRKSAPQ